MYIPANETIENRLERILVVLLVKDILAAGYQMRVDDGEEVHQFTYNVESTMANLMETDQDYLRVYDVIAPAQRKGSIALVYGNEPYNVVSDHSDNDTIADLLKKHEERCELFSNVPEALWTGLLMTLPGATEAEALRAGSSAKAVR